MEKESKKSLKEKCVFYATAFFILLGTFSLFSFLFLVPFVIEPAYTTITMDFDCNPILCTTLHSEYKQGVSNCSWSSCREGCTKDIYDCTQITIRYRNYSIKTRRIQDIDHYDESDLNGFIQARLFPNVKGCGYPPHLNCSMFFHNFTIPGTKFPCYYSRIDPYFVITEFNIQNVYLNLIYALAIPIPSFIISVLYLFYAYFNIYTMDPDPRLLLYEHQNEDDDLEKNINNSLNGNSGLSPASETFRENLLSFGQQLKVSMVDDQNEHLSKDNLSHVHTNHSISSIEKEYNFDSVTPTTHLLKNNFKFVLCGNNEKQFIKATNTLHCNSPIDNV